MNAEKDFIKFSILHHELSVAGDILGSNRAHKNVSVAMSQLKHFPDQGLAFLKRSAKHEHPSVRLWSATFLVEFDKPLAIETLNKLQVDETPWQIQAMAETVSDLKKVKKLQ